MTKTDHTHRHKFNFEHNIKKFNGSFSIVGVFWLHMVIMDEKNSRELLLVQLRNLDWNRYVFNKTIFSLITLISFKTIRPPRKF